MSNSPMSNNPMPNNAHSPHLPHPKVRHAICQRQMLHWMGVDVWVTKSHSIRQHSPATTCQSSQIIRFEATQLAQPNTQSAVDNQAANAKNAVAEYAQPEQSKSDKHRHHQPVDDGLVNIDMGINTDGHVGDAISDNQLIERIERTPVNNTPDNMASDVLPASIPTSFVTADAISRTDTTSDIATVSLELEGFCYNQHSILVDKKRLTVDEQKLWQNIVSALSGKPYQFAFPICEGMSDAEHAQQSLDGFLLRLGQQVYRPVLCLSTLPVGIHMTQAVKTPSLADMLTTPKLKYTFWQLLQAG